MIALRVTVPVACWRKGHARELLESEVLPPPATCYGALLSLVGETDRERHRGCRVTAGLLEEPSRSMVLRTLWRVKSPAVVQGNGENARPDFQQLVTGSDLVLFCDGSDEAGESLERRIDDALREPGSVDRFGGWSLGESTHLINDLWRIEGPVLPGSCRTFVLAPDGELTLPVWVDHVGAAGTKYATGNLAALTELPAREQLPQIPTS